MAIKKVLILAANPLEIARLRLDKEVEEIRTTLQLSTNRDRFEIESRGAVRPQDLQQYLYNLKPQILHFSGHGDGDWGLAFEDDDGKAQAVSTSALADWLNRRFGESEHNNCPKAFNAKGFRASRPPRLKSLPSKHFRSFIQNTSPKRLLSQDF